MAKRNKRQRIADRQKKIDDRALQLNVDANLSTTDESDSDKMKKKAGKLEKRSRKLEGKLDPNVARENTRKKLVDKRDKKIDKIEKRFPEPTKKFDKKEKKIDKAKEKFYNKLEDADKKRSEEESKILDSRSSFNEKRGAIESSVQEKSEDAQAEKNNNLERTKKQLLRGGKKIVKRLGKGKQVGKMLQRRAVKKALEITGSEEVADFLEDKLSTASALNKKDRNQMFQMGSAMGGAGSATPSVNTEGMTSADKRRVATAQIASDLEYFKMMNPVMKPTDYYPQMGRAIGVGTSTGEVIGSRTIYTGAGVLAPMGLYDARTRALAAATKAGIANAQGDMTKLPQVREQYIDRYNNYTNDLIDEIKADKDNIYFKNGRMTSAGRSKMNEAVRVGNTINRALARADEFQEHLTKLKTSGKGNMTGIDDVYYDPKVTTLMRELLEGKTDFDNFKDMKILEEIASGEGLEYRNAEKDFTKQIMPNLLKEAAQDQKNLMDDTYQGAEGENPSDFIDKSSGLLTQAYMKTVADKRIKDAVEAFYDANEGIYSDKQKEALIDLTRAQIGQRETITTKEQSSSGSGGSSARSRYFNTYFDGTTRGLKKETIPVINQLPTGSSNDDIAGAYLTTIGGVAGTTGMMSPDGSPVPVTRTALDMQGAPLPIGLGNVSNKFAVNVSGQGYKELSGQEIEDLLKNKVGVTAFGTGTECKLEWFQAYNDIGDIPKSQIYARSVEDINALGYVDGGTVIPLNASSLDDFKNANESSRVQIKSMMYVPVLEQPTTLEKKDASGNYQTVVVRELESTGGAYLVSKGPTTIPFNGSQQINTNLSNIQSNDFTSDKNLRNP